MMAGPAPTPCLTLSVCLNIYQSRLIPFLCAILVPFCLLRQLSYLLIILPLINSQSLPLPVLDTRALRLPPLL